MSEEFLLGHRRLPRNMIGSHIGYDSDFLDKYIVERVVAFYHYFHSLAQSPQHGSLSKETVPGVYMKSKQALLYGAQVPPGSLLRHAHPRLRLTQ